MISRYTCFLRDRLSHHIISRFRPFSTRSLGGQRVVGQHFHQWLILRPPRYSEMMPDITSKELRRSLSRLFPCGKVIRLLYCLDHSILLHLFQYPIVPAASPTCTRVNCLGNFLAISWQLNFLKKLEEPCLTKVF